MNDKFLDLTPEQQAEIQKAWEPEPEEHVVQRDRRLSAFMTEEDYNKKWGIAPEGKTPI